MVSTKIANEVYESLVAKAKEEGISVSELLRRILYEFIGKPAVYQGSTDLRKEIEDLKVKLKELEKKMGNLEREIKKLAGIMFWTR